MEGVTVLETERLSLRQLTPADAPFIMELVNEPSWLRFIGDKNVHCIADAERYIAEGPASSYGKHGFGLWLTETRAARTPVGICGLIKRDTLPHVDIGFAFLPRFWNQGYAYEAARATLDYARDTLGIARVVAVTLAENVSSIRLLERLGLRAAGAIRLADDGEELVLYAPPA
jgi:RimJ/RimL family protein N-acetyltransferase